MAELAPAAVQAVSRAVHSARAVELNRSCAALAMLAAGDGEDAAARRAALVQAGAPAALVAAAHEAVRAGHAGVLESACGALANLAAGDDADSAASRAALVQAGAPAALVAAAHEMVRAGHHMALLEMVCAALRNLA